MTDLEELKKATSDLNNTFKEQKQMLVGLGKKEGVVDWFKVEIKKHHIILEAFNLPISEIVSTRTACQKEPTVLLKEVEAALNGVGDIKADLLGHYDAKEIQRRIAVLSKRQSLLGHKVNDLLSRSELLVKSKQQVLANIKLPKLIKIGHVFAAKNRQKYTKGLKLAKLVLPELFKKENSASIGQWKTTGENLEKRLNALTISSGSTLAEEVLFRQIKICSFTASQVRIFLQAVETRFLSEKVQVGKLKEAIKLVRKDSNLTSLLNRLTAHSQSLSELVVGVASKFGIYEHLLVVPQTFELLNIFHLSFKNQLIPSFLTDCKSIGSSTNPTTIALKNTKGFFFGLAGMMRSLKLMYASIKGKGAFNEEELLAILEKAICSCRIFYGHSKKDIHLLKSFIDNLLVDYARPFPYNQLFQLTKKTIAEYGSAVEEYIFQHTVDEKYLSMAEIKIPPNMGKLIAAVHTKEKYFTKLVKGLV